jgi:hypothetical protein
MGHSLVLWSLWLRKNQRTGKKAYFGFFLERKRNLNQTRKTLSSSQFSYLILLKISLSNFQGKSLRINLYKMTQLFGIDQGSNHNRVLSQVQDPTIDPTIRLLQLQLNPPPEEDFDLKAMQALS